MKSHINPPAGRNGPGSPGAIGSYTGIGAVMELEPRFIRVNPRDNVGVVVNDGGLRAGTVFSTGHVLRDDIPQAHKVALENIGAGDPVIRYGEVIGVASRELPAGSWVRE